MADSDRVTILVGGMTCQHCVAAVKGKLSSMPGVAGVEVSLQRGEATVSGRNLDVSALRAAIEDLGYDAG